MKLSKLCQLCGNDILYKNIINEEIECDLSLGIHWLYPGCNISFPITEGFCHSFVCSYDDWEWFLAGSEDVAFSDSALIIVCGAKKPCSPPDNSIAANIIFVGFSVKTLLSRISNLSSQRYLSPASDELYDAFWAHVKESKVRDYVNTSAYLEKLPHPVHEYLALIVIRHYTDTNNSFYSEDMHTPNLAAQILNALRTFFSGINVLYDSETQEFIVLYSQKTPDSYSFYYPLHDFSYLKFSDLLKKYHLHAGMSNSGRAVEHLYTQYVNARNALEIGESLKTPPHIPNIYHHMEYVSYNILHFCLPEFVRQYGHDNIIYLVHPATVDLHRYDSTNNTNLLDTLHTYLSNGHSITETADAMFLHRNTISNRIRKIKEITSLSVENPQVQDALLTSCKILQYYRDVIKKSF